MPCNDDAPRDGLHQLSELEPAEEEDREEGCSTTREGTFGIQWLTVDFNMTGISLYPLDPQPRTFSEQLEMLRVDGLCYLHKDPTIRPLEMIMKNLV